MAGTLADTMTDPSPVGGPSDLVELLPPHVLEKYPYAKGYFMLRPPEDTEIVSCRDLLVPATLTALLERFAVSFPDSDRRAVASLWSMYYFSTLTIGAAIAALEAGRTLPLKLDEIGLCLQNGTAQPHGFLLSGPGHEGGSETTALEEVLKRHAEPLIEALVVAGRVSRKLLWSNVLSYLGWIVDEIAGSSVGGAAPRWAGLVRDRSWPDGWLNPMHGLIRPEVDESGAPCARRRVCCLRYALPSIGGCGAICPIPAGRH